LRLAGESSVIVATAPATPTWTSSSAFIHCDGTVVRQARRPRGMNS
jgi:hypothetical protein